MCGKVVFLCAVRLYTEIVLANIVPTELSILDIVPGALLISKTARSQNGRSLFRAPGGAGSTGAAEAVGG